MIEEFTGEVKRCYIIYNMVYIVLYYNDYIVHNIIYGMSAGLCCHGGSATIELTMTSICPVAASPCLCCSFGVKCAPLSFLVIPGSTRNSL